VFFENGILPERAQESSALVIWDLEEYNEEAVAIFKGL